jgi:hypothetical protein
MNFTFTGCSFTVGQGLELEKNDTDNYCNIVTRKYSAIVKNLGRKGNSNYCIFMDAMNEILFHSPDKIFVQWSGLSRLWLYPGPDSELYLSHTVKQDYSYRDIYFSQKEMQKFSDQYHLLNHDYHNILTLINYCNILAKVAQGRTQIIFINGLLPWTNEICRTDIGDNYVDNLSKYTKELLDFDNRSDEELDSMLVSLNDNVMSLDHSLWVNLFDSFIGGRIDVGHDSKHPGPNSHNLYAKMVIKHLENTW